MLNKLTGFDTTGCWTMVLVDEADLLTEIKNLALREDLDWNDLLGHDNKQMIGYTHYSSCTYIKEGLPICLYWGEIEDHFGIFIRPFNRRIDWWYNGNGGIASDDTKPEPGIPYNNGGKAADQLRNCTMSDIDKGVITLKKEHEDYKAKNHSREAIQLSWNEAFLRYQRKDITGLHVNPKSKLSVYNALVFKAALKLNVDLYVYDEASGTCNCLNSYTLCKKLEINMQLQAIKDAKRYYRQHYTTCLAEVRAARETAEIPEVRSSRYVPS